MNTLNTFLNTWWSQREEEKAKYKAPDSCTFCSNKIEDGDYFYAGYDDNRIYAETCDAFQCHKWLKWKARIRRMAGKDYKKEVEDRYGDNN